MGKKYDSIDRWLESCKERTFENMRVAVMKNVMFSQLGFRKSSPSKLHVGQTL